MEIAGFLAANLVGVLAPALGRLLSRTADKFTDRASDRITEASFKRAEELWRTIRPKVEANPGALRAAERVAQQPDNEDFQAALRVELDELLASDPRFRRRVETKLLSLGVTHVEQRGDHSVMIGRDNQGTVINAETYYAYGNGASQLDDFRQSHPLAKVLVVLGMAVALAGFGLFMFGIFQGISDSPSLDDPNFGEGPDTTFIIAGFATMFAGIVIAAVGGAIAGLTKRRS